MNNLARRNAPIPLSSHVLDIPKSATLAINEKSKQLILDGQDVISLGLGQSPFPVPGIMTSALKNYGFLGENVMRVFAAYWN